MHTFFVPIEGKAKPAGTVFNGRISMNKRGYSEWKALADASCKYLSGNELPKGLMPYGWAIVHSNPKWNRGDLLNLAGASMDTMVRLGVVQDDAPRWVNKLYTSLDRGNAGITIYICENRVEFVELLCLLA
jgi:hypothetical protein